MIEIDGGAFQQGPFCKLNSPSGFSLWILPVAGVLLYRGVVFLFHRMRVDDAMDFVSIHLTCGVWVRIPSRFFFHHLKFQRTVVIQNSSPHSLLVWWWRWCFIYRFCCFHQGMLAVGLFAQEDSLLAIQTASEFTGHGFFLGVGFLRECLLPFVLGPIDVTHTHFRSPGLVMQPLLLPHVIQELSSQKHTHTQMQGGGRLLGIQALSIVCVLAWGFFLVLFFLWLCSLKASLRVSSHAEDQGELVVSRKKMCVFRIIHAIHVMGLVSTCLASLGSDFAACSPVSFCCCCRTAGLDMQWAGEKDDWEVYVTSLSNEGGTVRGGSVTQFYTSRPESMLLTSLQILG